jgi:toxin FitB
LILLDTNVLSEWMRGPLDAAVAAWMHARLPEELFISSICEAELRYGIDRLPRGQRRERLEESFRTLLTEGFTDRVIAFDSSCAAGYAAVRVRREAAGRPISLQDALIAGTALAHGAAVATRNTRDFADCGVEVIDPWRPSA